MRRIWMYLVAAVLVVGCKSAARRGEEHGCEDGAIVGAEHAEGDAAACEEPASVPVGCNAPSGGMFRRAKYKDAYRPSYQQCYQAAYEGVWTREQWAEECDGTLDTAQLPDTGPS